MKPGNIPSYQHRHWVKQLVQPLNALPYFGGYCLAMTLPGGQYTWLSSTPRVTVKTISSGLSRSELLLSQSFLQRNRVIFPDEFVAVDDMQRKTNAILNQLGVYRAYCLSRFCSDCNLIIGINTTKPLTDLVSYYTDTVDVVEKFSVGFLQQTLNVYLEQLPPLKTSRFALEPEYRHKVIYNRNHLAQDVQLSNSEKLVLYWSAQGKSAQQVADITGFSKNTVDSYRRDLIKKLQATNITQAVYVASHLNLIV